MKKLIIILTLILMFVGCNFQEPDYGIVVRKEYVKRKHVTRYNPNLHIMTTQVIPEKWMVEIVYYYPENRTYKVKVSIDKEEWSNVREGDSVKYEELTKPSFIRRRD